MLMTCCPVRLGEQDTVTLRGMLDKWLRNVRGRVELLPGDADDRAVISSCASSIRGIMHLVALVNPESDQDAISRATRDWILTVINNVTGDNTAADRMNFDVLHNLLVAAREVRERIPEDIVEALRGFGCMPQAIQRLSDDQQRALLHRCYEWQTCEETDPITLEPLIQDDGKLAPNVAIFVKAGSDGKVHVYGYFHGSLLAWIANGGVDPQTRDPVRSQDIISIS